MIQLSDVALDVLWREGDFTLSRVSPRNGQRALLLRSNASTPLSVGNMRRAHGLRNLLDSSWAAKPLDLVDYEGQAGLLTEDPGVDILASLMGEPWDLRPFLLAAVGLSATIARLHASGLVHKDIKPSNLLIRRDTGEAWLSGFGFASRLARERQMAETPDTIPGTLAYMSPEQTGRMNRSVDSRSDLYALGTTFYEMLVGSLPFSAADPIGWIHCQVAQAPVPLHERRGSIPLTLSAIVSKLMAKNADEHYQTAAGLETDLRRCLLELDATGRISSFPLAEHDVPDRLLFPGRLYGRDREIESLLEAFQNVTKRGRQALVLVAGYSGVGKSSVVNELLKAVIPLGGRFASGKFNQYERGTPFAPIVSAFREIVRSILGLPDRELARWRQNIQSALGAHAQLIVEVIPEVGLIVGPQKTVPALPPGQEQARLHRALGRFIGVLARPDHPLVLFLDDLQWLDPATLDLLQTLLASESGLHLLIVGAYRDNEVGPSHPLTSTLDNLRSSDGVSEIALSTLALEDIHQLISDTLHRKASDTRSLSEMVHERTGGNPFFAVQFLMALAADGGLVFEPGSAAWTWNVEQIRSRGYTDNVVELIAGNVVRLAAAEQEILRQLACLSGGSASTLAMVNGCDEDHIHLLMSGPVAAGLVQQVHDGYAFCHDRIQEAAYALTPEADLPATHLRMARRLVDSLPKAALQESIFEVVHLFSRGATLIARREERVGVARLNLDAARRARSACAYASALVHLSEGEALLEDGDWAAHYDLRFPLALLRGECDFLSGDLSSAERRLAELVERTVGPLDLASVTCLRIHLYLTMDKMDRAVEVALAYLRPFGIPWPSHPAQAEVTAAYQDLRQCLNGKPIETLVELPRMRDAGHLALMEVLLAVEPAARFSDQNLHELVVLKMTMLSQEHGSCDVSTVAYAYMAFIGPRFDEYTETFRWGELALALVDRGFERFSYQAFAVVSYHILPWTRPLQEASQLMQRAFDLAREADDHIFAAFSACHLSSYQLLAAQSLEETHSIAESHLALCREAGFGLMAACVLGQLDLIGALRGTSPEEGRALDHEDTRGEAEPRENRTGSESRLKEPRLAFAACWYWVRRTQALVHEGRYAEALETSARAESFPWITSTFLEIAEHHFYSALAHARSWDKAAQDAREKHRLALAAHHVHLVTRTRHCPETFASRASLVSAEIARLQGDGAAAERGYEDAIRLGQEGGFSQVVGLAAEYAAHFHASRGFTRIADAYVACARTAYRQWGADALLVRLGGTPTGPASVQVSHSVIPHQPSGHSLDLATFVKASQALSGEIVTQQLVDKLMTIALQHAGAQQGHLLLQREDRLMIVAEASTSPEGIAVRFVGRAAEPNELPDSILRYVVRTRTPLVLDDASTPNAFSDDAYIAARAPRSIICLPLLKQNALSGVLYLENNASSHVFTPERLALLNLVASQAAISLENARLYGEVQELKEELQKENLVLREEIDSASMFEEIVGRSAPLRNLLSQVARVAPTDSTVLITGETGTGKELIARAMHRRSRRSGRLFVSVNCAAIPQALIASELFGHEKGAFTGAFQRKLGRFELAEGGTLFLDEVGDLPTETQIALLRALQEREIDRVGGSRPIPINVRVVAATNRDLKAAVAEGVFRADLYYRLNVFPVEMPPLRSRPDDIPLLVSYFADRYAARAGKNLRGIKPDSLALLQAYDWPGNVRELQNVIERAVILCETDSLSIEESWVPATLPSGSTQEAGPSELPALRGQLTHQEKVMIESALAATQGRVSGPLGAAAKLKLAASTLESRIRSLGIDKQRFKRTY
ncbi:MAG: sigma 54-interacting transcriptional regulator [Vicinamibacteria bacterium]